MAQGSFEHRGSQVSSKTNTSGQIDHPLFTKRARRRKSGGSHAVFECAIQIEKSGGNDICYAVLVIISNFQMLAAIATVEADEVPDRAQSVSYVGSGLQMVRGTFLRSVPLKEIDRKSTR
jgi:hypothetical protein